MRRRTPALAAAAGLTALLVAWLVVRDSSLVDVERVTVAGATGPDAPRVRSALEREALTMSTLHVSEGELEDAVARFPTVAGVEVDRDLPHALVVKVRERVPVGTVDTAGTPTPIDADGRLLHGAAADASLPALESPRPELVQLLAAAPDELRRRGARAYVRPSGVAVDMRAGPTLVFGRAEALERKWTAAARVLADPAAEGARYLDLRIPERPAAGGVLTLDSSLSPAEPTDAPAEVEPEP